ncbi:MAG TPA: hypothetical protein DDZ88_03755 [Verrucomicrobiales bacterium]|nr:hypothetical protein [Verrucomicrobiales bacterium]
MNGTQPASEHPANAGDARRPRARPADEEKRWEKRYAELAAFKEMHGHLRVTRQTETSCGLLRWRDNQRAKYRNGTLREDWIARLDALGLEWEMTKLPAHEYEYNEEQWERMFDQLVAHRAKHGDCEVPVQWPENQSLSEWAKRQRRLHRDGQMPAARARRLEQLGFTWKSKKPHLVRQWEERFAELVAFQKRHGHLRVTRQNETSPGLNEWRNNQRVHLRKGKLSAERKARLEALGFEWAPRGRTAYGNADLWELRFGQLVAYQTVHGHCQVPRKQGALSEWVNTQRKARRNGRLREDRRERLEQIGFAWESGRVPQTGGWEGRYAELVAFKAKHGHLGVTPSNQTSAGLTRWRDKQRQKLRTGRLSPERKARLDALGFEWESPGVPRPAPASDLPKDSLSLWEHFFERLVAFKEQHGHLNVPNEGKEQRQIVAWMREQRSGHVYGRLHFDQITRLEKLGFAWKAPSLPVTAPAGAVI